MPSRFQRRRYMRQVEMIMYMTDFHNPNHLSDRTIEMMNPRQRYDHYNRRNDCDAVLEAALKLHDALSTFR